MVGDARATQRSIGELFQHQGRSQNRDAIPLCRVGCQNGCIGVCGTRNNPHGWHQAQGCRHVGVEVSEQMATGPDLRQGGRPWLSDESLGPSTLLQLPSKAEIVALLSE